ncbi:MAG: DUF72 domain-containing protein [Candidatus Aminicenantia bacterium]
MREIIMGCAGFSKSQSVYYREFSVVEIQKTFYDPPPMKTLKKWRSDAPSNFEFTIKAWQVITHRPSSPTYRKMKGRIKGEFGSFLPTKSVMDAWKITRECAVALNTKIIIFQCPCSFTPKDENIENMKKFFKSIDRNNFILGWEPRGDNWKDEIVKEICEEFSLVHVVDPFQRNPVSGALNYFRLHGIGGARYKFQEKDFEFLLSIATKEKNYIIFNNISSYEDSLKFKKWLEERKEV